MHRYEHSLQHHYNRYVHPHDPNDPDPDSTYKPSDDSGSDTSHEETESRRHRQHHHRKSSPRGIVVSAEFRKHSEDTIREILARLEQRQHEMNSQRMYTLGYNNTQDERVFHTHGYEIQRVHHSRQRLRHD
ncbi:hypothetical protein BG003_011529 [Podila horticola]|nr:hypothetical protein BG003_011529 [Podila horticola]